MQERKNQQSQIEIVIDGLEVSVFGVLRGIRGVMEAANLSDAEKVAATTALLDQGKTTDFDQLKTTSKIPPDASWYDIWKAAREAANRLSPVLRPLNFMPTVRASPF